MQKLKNDILCDVNQFIIENSIYFNGRDTAQFFQIAKEIVTQLDIALVAGEFDKGVKWTDYFRENRFFILIGGGKLERGFTIEGLITTFLTRSSADGNADSIQQRARFYGSKLSIRHSITVFMTDKVHEDFQEYWINERELFNIVEAPIRSNDFKMRFINVGRPSFMMLIEHLEEIGATIILNFRMIIMRVYSIHWDMLRRLRILAEMIKIF
jgi:hypothetical protein